MQNTNPPEPQTTSSIGEETLEQTLARWARQEEEARDRVSQELAQVLECVLRESPQRKYLVAGYNGSGDEGCFEYVGFVGTGDEAESCHAWYAPESLVTGLPEGIDERRLEDLLGQFIPSGYENNEGGQGIVRINLGTGEIEVDHEYNVTEIISEPRSFQLGHMDDVA